MKNTKRSRTHWPPSRPHAERVVEEHRPFANERLSDGPGAAGRCLKDTGVDHAPWKTSFCR
jgi:hypothetical protein